MKEFAEEIFQQSLLILLVSFVLIEGYVQREDRQKRVEETCDKGSRRRKRDCFQVQ